MISQGKLSIPAEVGFGARPSGKENYPSAPILISSNRVGNRKVINLDVQLGTNYSLMIRTAGIKEELGK